MVSTVIAVPQQVQDIWLQEALEIKFAPKRTDLEAALEVKALDVKSVSVRSPDESVLEVRHDLLPGDVSHDGHHPHQNELDVHLIVLFMLRCLSRCLTSLSVRVRFRTLRSLWLLRGRRRFLLSSTWSMVHYNPR